uniref:Uncharacterized protein n=1 Tax=Tanacetum cinerariifolium TaxID=118510 RepID=A0A6L2MDT6_TANCI|nr:hypothetical protein [Tanacetum cinerariifolium]
MLPISFYPTHEKPPMPPTEGYLTEKEPHQLMLDEKALKETLEEKTRTQKEFDEINKRLEEEARKEQAHDELFRLECRVKSDSEYESD